MTTETGTAGKPAKKPGRKKTKFTVADCDRVFSIYIRLRDTKGNYGNCAACRRGIHYASCHNGHYVGRQFYKYRWDPKNCAACCVNCNVFLEGNKGPFSRWIDKTWGAGTAEMLDGTKTGGREPKSYELKEIYEQIQEAIKQQETP